MAPCIAAKISHLCPSWVKPRPRPQARKSAPANCGHYSLETGLSFRRDTVRRPLCSLASHDAPGRIVFVMKLPRYLMIGVGGYWLWGLHYISSPSDRYKRGGHR
jgi:hypothetical protein